MIIAPILILDRFGSTSEAVDEACRLQSLGAAMLQVDDGEGERLGAPSRVQTLAALLEAVNIPVQFFGGVSGVHIGEMLLGLGVDKLVAGASFWKTDSSPAHFGKRFGKRLLVRSADPRVDPWDRSLATEIGGIQVRAGSGTVDWGRGVKGVQLICSAREFGRHRNLESIAGVKLSAVLIDCSPQEFGECIMAENE